MYVNFIIQRFGAWEDDIALITDNVPVTYGALDKEFSFWDTFLKENKVVNKVVAVQGEFCLPTIGLMLAVIENANVYVPLAESVKNPGRYLKVSQAQVLVDPYKKTLQYTGVRPGHPILCELLEKRKRPGMILFSSGTMGEPKAAVHDLVPMLKKYNKIEKKIKSIAFLLFDHIGGFNTVMYNIAGGGTLVTLRTRSPEAVCSAISKYNVTVLPISPSFMNMMLYSRIYEKYDISSLELVTYGTEPMPVSTLSAFCRLFPKIRLKQTYGLSELGIMRTRSKSSDSLWLKLGDEDHRVDIRDGVLWIKTNMAMLGYLNADAPFDDNGWFNTQDRVAVKEGYIRILGRESELINVGGEKVYPAEVESVLLDIEGVNDAVVRGVDNPLMGQVVGCVAAVDPSLSPADMKKRIKKVCLEKLEKYKRPVTIEFDHTNFVTDRLKRKR